MKKVVVHKRERVFDDYFVIDEAEVSFEQSDGSMSAPHKRQVFVRGDSVAAVLYKRDTNKAVFVKQFRFATFEKGPGWMVEIVAGMCDKDDESHENSIKREIAEETGYQVEQVEPVLHYFVSPGASPQICYLYYAEISDAMKTEQGGGLNEEHEDIEIVEYPANDLHHLLEPGAIQDAKTLIGIQWLIRRLEKETME